MKKDKQFSIRIAAQDLETIRQKAAQAHMSQSDYVTACCLGKRIVILDGLKEVLRQQKAIGNNLNHLHFFSYRSLPLNVTPAGIACGSCRLCGVRQKRFQRRARNKNSASHSDCMQLPAADQLICAATPNAQDFCNFFHTQRQWKIIQIINHCNFPLLGFDWYRCFLHRRHSQMY